MEGSLKELAGYRLERAREMLLASENNLKIGEYRTSLNRTYLKTEILDRNLAAMIKESSLCREKSDYDDFYVAGCGEAEEQLKNAKYFVQKVGEYVNLMNESL